MPDFFFFFFFRLSYFPDLVSKVITSSHWPFVLWIYFRMTGLRVLADFMSVIGEGREKVLHLRRPSASKWGWGSRATVLGGGGTLDWALACGSCHVE